LPTVPVLVVQGDRDPFGVPPRARRRTVKVIAGADHALRRDSAAVAAAVLTWLNRQLAAR
jgi:pimeloyl-ACP methyl ester carboxylesterase